MSNSVTLIKAKSVIKKIEAYVVHPRCKAAVFKALMSKKLKHSTGLLYDVILAVGFFLLVVCLLGFFKTCILNTHTERTKIYPYLNVTISAWDEGEDS